MYIKKRRLNKIEAVYGLAREGEPEMIRGPIEYDKDGLYLYRGKKYKSLEELGKANNAIVGGVILKPTRHEIDNY